ncbi:MAG: ABC transporter permease [Candidatus Micrarchaeota archaeon]
MLASFKKELKEIAHERAMLAVLLIFPVLLMLFLGSSYGDVEIKGVPIAVTGASNSEFSQALVGALNGSGTFKVHSEYSYPEALNALKEAKVRAVISIPQSFEEDLKAGRGSAVAIIVDNSDVAVSKSVLAALAGVVQGSSANITTSYLSTAWADLRELGANGASLRAKALESRKQLEETRLQIQGISASLESFDVGALGDDLDDMFVRLDDFDALLNESEVKMGNLSASLSGENSSEIKETLENLENYADEVEDSLSEAENRTASTKERTKEEIRKLNDTHTALLIANSSLNLVKDELAGSSCDASIPGVTAVILAIGYMDNSTLGQMEAMEQQLGNIDYLNATIQNAKANISLFKANLTSVKQKVEESENQTKKMNETLSQLRVSLQDARVNLAGARSNLEKSKQTVDELKTLLVSVKGAMLQVNETVEDALAESESVESMLARLEGIVNEQTSKAPEKIAQPLSVQLKNEYARNSLVDFMMPQIIAISLLFTCLLLSSVNVVREKTRKTIIRIILIPGAVRRMIVGKTAVAVLFAIIQVLLIALVASLFFGVQISSDASGLIIGGAIAALCFSLIGVLIGILAPSESSAIQTCIMIAIPMMFLGNVIFSRDLLPNYSQVAVDALPLAHVVDIFKKLLITGADIAPDAWFLLAYAFALLVLITLVLRRREAWK